jgi:hypothetical protein
MCVKKGPRNVNLFFSDYLWPLDAPTPELVEVSLPEPAGGVWSILSDLIAPALDPVVPGPWVIVPGEPSVPMELFVPDPVPAPPAALPPPAPPAPCATAKVLAIASAPASAIVASFILSSCFGPEKRASLL